MWHKHQIHVILRKRSTLKKHLLQGGALIMMLTQIGRGLVFYA